MKAKTPHWPLERLKELVAADKVHIHGKVFENFATPGEARTRTKEVCMSLSTDEFAETVTLTWDTADVYGVRFRDSGWYLKVTIDEEIPEAVCISFHPLKFSLRTNRGEVKP
jgi:hypothetical protein